MAAPPETIEQQLIADLHELRERFSDEKFMTELYRALCNTIWFKDDPSDHVALSWKLAEELVNTLRGEVGAPPLSLQASGREGEVAGAVEEELGRLGWHHRPLDTDEHDPRHLESAEDPPPQSRTTSRKREG